MFLKWIHHCSLVQRFFLDPNVEWEFSLSPIVECEFSKSKCRVEILSESEWKFSLNSIIEWEFSFNPIVQWRFSFKSEYQMRILWVQLSNENSLRVQVPNGGFLWSGSRVRALSSMGPGWKFSQVQIQVLSGSSTDPVLSGSSLRSGPVPSGALLDISLIIYKFIHSVLFSKY